MEDIVNKLGILENKPSYLGGKCLVASPSMLDFRFDKSVIFVCAHSSEGAMGFIINKNIPNIGFDILLEQLELPKSEVKKDVRFGGPVETGRGFVLHSTEYIKSGSLIINHQFAMTATVDIIKDISKNKGPEFSCISLGYTGWSKEQLEEEIKSNSWLIAPADSELVFGSNYEGKWEKALEKIGIDKTSLSSEMGNA